MKKIFFVSVLTFVVAVCVLSSFKKNNSSAHKIRFNHLALYVYNLQASTNFYNKILQLDTIPNPFNDGKHTWLSMGEHNQLHLISGNTKEQSHIKDTHLCISVSSFNEFILQLDKAGVTYTNWQGNSKTPTQRADGVKQIYLQDPDGYWIEVNSDTY